MKIVKTKGNRPKTFREVSTFIQHMLSEKRVPSAYLGVYACVAEVQRCVQGPRAAPR